MAMGVPRRRQRQRFTVRTIAPATPSAELLRQPLRRRSDHLGDPQHRLPRRRLGPSPPTSPSPSRHGKPAPQSSPRACRPGSSRALSTSWLPFMSSWLRGYSARRTESRAERVTHGRSVAPARRPRERAAVSGYLIPPIRAAIAPSGRPRAASSRMRRLRTSRSILRGRRLVWESRSTGNASDSRRRASPIVNLLVGWAGSAFGAWWRLVRPDRRSRRRRETVVAGAGARSAPVSALVVGGVSPSAATGGRRYAGGVTFPVGWDRRDRWTLRFVDPELERSFSTPTRPQSVRRARTASLIAVVVWVLVALVGPPRDGVAPGSRG